MAKTLSLSKFGSSITKITPLDQLFLSACVTAEVSMIVSAVYNVFAGLAFRINYPDLIGIDQLFKT
jgi:hypothetical protein